jgi:ANTAR domain
MRTDGSAQSIIMLIWRLTGADGCAWYEAQKGDGTLKLRVVVGSGTPDEKDLPYRDVDRMLDKPGWTSLPVYLDGQLLTVLVLAFANGSAKTTSLKPLLPLVRVLLRLLNTRAMQLRWAARISEIETELASEKISSRIDGILEETSSLAPDTIKAVETHVAKVLASCEFSRSLQDRLNQMETQLVERDRTTRAKTYLQKRHGLTEAEAYQQLRALSRRKRLKMSEIALDVISD